jgi:hypothetical protein
LNPLGLNRLTAHESRNVQKLLHGLKSVPVEDIVINLDAILLL